MIAISENITFSFEQILTERTVCNALWSLTFKGQLLLLPDLEIEYLGVL